MKGKLKCLLLVAMALMLFAGCSNIVSDDANVSGEGILDGECLISVGVEGVENNRSRTIISDTIYDDTTVFKRLVITGDSIKGMSIEHEFTAAELNAKSATISLPYDIWYLTLTAYDNNPADTTKFVPVLSGTSIVDLKNDKPSSISFKLTPNKVTSEGTLDLTATFKDPSYGNSKAITKCNIGLYTIEDDLLVANTSAELTPEAVMDETVPTKYLKSKIEYKANDATLAGLKKLKPGSYMLKIWFYPATGNSLGFYSDEVMIAPGRETKGTISIPDVIEKLPNKPDNLKVLLAKDTDKDGHYNAYVKWDDRSDNEENFILKVIEYSDNTNTATTTAVEYGKDAAAATDTANKKVIFFGDERQVMGTLATSTTECVIKLDAGKLYDFEIAAQNVVGTSEFVERKAVESTDITTNLLAFDKLNDDGSYTKCKVNRVWIEYNLDSGTLELAANKKYTNVYNEYKTYQGENLVLQNGRSFTTTDYPKAERNHNPFVKWNYASTAGVTFVEGNKASGDDPNAAGYVAAADDTYTYNSWKNLKLKASYDPTFIVSYTVADSVGDIDDADVTAEADISTSSGDCKNKVLDLKTKVEDTTPTNPEFKFQVKNAEAIKVYIGERLYTNDGDTIIINTANEPLDSKTYAVTVMGKVKRTGDSNAKWYSKVFAVTIAR